MLQAYGEHGGRVRKPLRTAGGVLCIGAEITAETALKWPLKNRMAMDRTQTVFWYPSPVGVAEEASTSPPPSVDGAEGAAAEPPALQEGAEGGGPNPNAGPGQPPPDSEGGPGEAPVTTGVPPSTDQPGVLPPVDPVTAERDELRSWLIKAGDEPAPALGTDKLRQRVRDKLVALAAEPKKEG